MSIDASSMSYTEMRTCLLGSHLTCRESILALSATSLSSIPKPNRYHKRKGRWEKKDAKLLNANFIREVRYSTWLANIVMVKKVNGKWRICTDYTNLNKACPNDAYPLPNIDKLVDGVSRFQVLSFLDAYSGYNQIRVHNLDKDKTTFITEDANFFYRVMPFDLKKANATY